MEGEKSARKSISKKHFRCHAHTNPFRDSNIDVPSSPAQVDWMTHFADARPPLNVDIGCGYGRFLFKLSTLFPQENTLGLEIRDKVFEYVKIRTEGMANCSVVKTNALIFLPNFFEKESLKRIFILFPDPHFKKRKQKGRVLCRQNVPVFRYLLAPGGLIYVSTDVKELFDEMCKVLEEGNFKHSPEHEKDAVFECCYRDTDEAHRAGVKSGHTFGRVFQRP